jgi:hypothetical protein
MGKYRVILLLIGIQALLGLLFMDMSAASQTLQPIQERLLPESDSLSSDSDTQGMTAESESTASKFYFFQYIPGSAFVPNESGMTYQRYPGSDCIELKDTYVEGAVFTYGPQFPHGSVVDFMRIYYYDGNPSRNVWVLFSSYEGEQRTYNLIRDDFSMGVEFFSSKVSPEFEHIVDNQNQSLLVEAKLGEGVSGTLKFCGVRFRYHCTTPNCTYMPACFR